MLYNEHFKDELDEQIRPLVTEGVLPKRITKAVKLIDTRVVLVAKDHTPLRRLAQIPDGVTVAHASPVTASRDYENKEGHLVIPEGIATDFLPPGRVLTSIPFTYDALLKPEVARILKKRTDFLLFVGSDDLDQNLINLFLTEASSQYGCGFLSLSGGSSAADIKEMFPADAVFFGKANEELLVDYLGTLDSEKRAGGLASCLAIVEQEKRNLKNRLLTLETMRSRRTEYEALITLSHQINENDLSTDLRLALKNTHAEMTYRYKRRFAEIEEQGRLLIDQQLSKLTKRQLKDKEAIAGLLYKDVDRALRQWVVDLQAEIVELATNRFMKRRDEIMTFFESILNNISANVDFNLSVDPAKQSVQVTMRIKTIGTMETIFRIGIGAGVGGSLASSLGNVLGGIEGAIIGGFVGGFVGGLIMRGIVREANRERVRTDCEHWVHKTLANQKIEIDHFIQLAIGNVEEEILRGLRTLLRIISSHIKVKMERMAGAHKTPPKQVDDEIEKVEGYIGRLTNLEHQIETLLGSYASC